MGDVSNEITEASERAERLRSTTDVTVWAKEWVATAAEMLARNNGDYLALLDEGWMIGWFANYAQACNDNLAQREVHLGTWHAFMYFYHLDSSNAAFHTAQPKFSPITFRLAEFVYDTYKMAMHPTLPIFIRQDPTLNEVLSAKGRYPEDTGR